MSENSPKLSDHEGQTFQWNYWRDLKYVAMYELLEKAHITLEQLQSIPFASEGAVEKRKMLMTLLFIYFLKHFNNKICNTEKTKKKTALHKRCHSIKYQLPFEGESIAK